MNCRWQDVFRKACSTSRVKNFTMLIKPKDNAKEITGAQILRKFSEYIKRPIIKAGAEVLKHIDATTKKPHSGTSWQDVLVAIEEWWRTQELTRKELDKRRRTAKAWNKEPEVVDGSIPSKTIPEFLSSSWVCPPRRSNQPFQDPLIPLIARFVPKLCEGLGFPPSPACFTGRSSVSQKFKVKRKRRPGHSEASSTSRALTRQREVNKKRKNIVQNQR